MIGERETLRLLAAIKDLALPSYPYEGDGPRIDANLVLALGQITSIASKAIAECAKKTEK